MFVVWGGNGGGVADSPSMDSAQEFRGREASLGNHGPWRRTTNLQGVFSNREGTKELSRRGVSGTGWEADDNEGKLPPPEC